MSDDQKRVGKIRDGSFPGESSGRGGDVAARSRLDRQRREAIAAQGISTFLRELYKCGGSITFSYGGGITRGSTLPEGVTAQEMVERLQAVASAEVADV